MSRTAVKRALAAIAAVAVAIALLAVAFAYADAQGTADEQTDACETANTVCDEPESCCAGAEDVLKELGRV